MIPTPILYRLIVALQWNARGPLTRAVSRWAQREVLRREAT